MHHNHDPRIPPAHEPTAEPLPETIVEAVADVVAKREIGGRPGLDPTRYGDWEKAGRCIDF